MKRLYTFVLLLLIVQAASAQGKQFSVCALNVDGLPKKVATYDVNPDGPGSEGTRKISAYLAGKGYDFIAVSEDFNYNGSLLSCLEGYNSGTWRGALDASGLGGALTSGMKFDTDGLNLLWKAEHQATEERWTSWTTTYGNLDHGFDENVDKGFRYYKLTLNDGTVIDCYILHMDAETDAGDIAAREVQLSQLADEIIANANGRPKIVMGDTNCRYTRDQVKKLFVNAITTGTSYTVRDVWVEYSRKGNYPQYYNDGGWHDLVDTSKGVDGPDNEIVDKIFYLNPPQGLQLKLKSMRIEDDYHDSEGNMLGDHYPLVAEFETVGTQLLPTEAKNFWEGEPLPGSGTQRYLYNVGSGYFLCETGSMVSAVSQASLWALWGDGDERTFSTDNGYRLVLGYEWKRLSYYCRTQNSSGATTFSLQTGWSRPDAYKLKASDHYVNVEWNDNYALDAGKSYDSNLSDWLFISPEQCDLYNSYVETWNRALAFIDYPVPEDIRTQLQTALQASVKYTTATASIASLNQAVSDIRQYIASMEDEVDCTSKIQNPSFEKKDLIKKLGDKESSENHKVYGWTVSYSSEAEEAFAAWENPENENGRYFTGMDGTHLFNAWSWGGNGTFYCKQEISITKAGYYELSAIVASGGGDEGDTWVNLLLGDIVQTSPTLTDRTRGIELKAYAYLPKGKYTIGIQSPRWFKADNFQLKQRKQHIDEPGDVNSDDKINLTDIKTLLRIYLGKTAANRYADINADGSITIADLTNLIQIHTRQ